MFSMFASYFTTPVPHSQAVLTRQSIHLDDLVRLCNRRTTKFAPGAARRRPYILSLDGNIGAGKTTILNQLELRVDKEKVVVIREPVEDWSALTDPTDNLSILEKYYTSPHLYAFVFQVVIFHSLMKSIDEAIAQHPHCEMIVCERSLASSRHVFARMLKHQLRMSELEWRIYDSFFTTDVIQRYYPDKVVFLDVPPKICLEQILHRNRKGEETVTLDYLEDLAKFYREWIDTEKSAKCVYILQT